MSRSKPVASLGLDLDNEWSYRKIHGDPGWDSFPSYLDVIVPRFLELCAGNALTATVFVVGQDAALARNHAALRAIAAAGHEIGNHSFHHEPWMESSVDRAAIDREIAAAEAAIADATGQLPVGYRGPGFSLSPLILEVLAGRGYLYDASTFPTFIGPLARAYYFHKARLSADERRTRGGLFGSAGNGLQPLRPYQWRLPAGSLLEIPVTTIPLIRVPFHLSYVLYLSAWSPALALGYFRTALGLCRLAGVAPSLLLHPLDLLDRTDVAGLGFFPGMQLDRAHKQRIVQACIAAFADRYDVGPLRRHAEAVLKSPLPLRPAALSA